ncbi:hypothetical protein HUO13_24265 [Saccharopolyspora erythraea]|uniref:WXG100 family type VII secretion target n=1 Tax=Saccharopolyspora erythraea TaxID=1836 RepID=UPI001BA556CE|nr:hypothetical protein [Saccharopolyspora erythraea]QUH03518.1 hypothetical protein HUO13_24265 [Saccharopolyspora erythraea]
MTDWGDKSLIDAASAGVQDLAGAATAALEQAGPAGALAQPVVDALRNVWEGYFGSPLPPGGTNWNAYTHEQLYAMLWEGADVTDVSDVAAEWDRHGAELTGHAEGLHDQRGALERNWTGQAAGSAAGDLGALGDRTSDIGARAGDVAQATQSAGDALSTARNAMPPPPGDPAALAVTSAAAGAGAGAAVGAVAGAAAGGVGAGPGAVMGAAVGAVAGGGGSLFLASVAAAEQKAQAVHVMQRYEQSLLSSSRAIAPASTASASAASGGAAAATSPAGLAGSGAAGGAFGGGVPWGKLTGSGGPLDPGLVAGGSRAGAGGLAGRAGAASGLAAARAANRGGMVPGGGAGARERDDEETVHRNRMPVIDHRLFDFDEPVMPPVIGQ